MVSIVAELRVFKVLLTIWSADDASTRNGGQGLTRSLARPLVAPLTGKKANRTASKTDKRTDSHVGRLRFNMLRVMSEAKPDGKKKCAACQYDDTVPPELKAKVSL